MPGSCPIPTAAERRYGEIQGRIREAMIRKVDAALQDAVEQARAEVAGAGLDLQPPSAGFFAAAIHQAMFCKLCGADPDTFAGGKAEVAVAVIGNSQNIAKHHWGAEVEPYPRTQLAKAD